MSGRVHRQELRGLSTSAGKGGVKTQGDTSPDGASVDYHGMQAATAAAERKRGDANEPTADRVAGNPDPGAKSAYGESGSEMLDYQTPCPQTKRGRRGISR